MSLLGRTLKGAFQKMAEFPLGPEEERICIMRQDLG